jgi:aldose 1-epimerase
MGIQKTGFGTTKDGQAVDLYTLTNANGMEVKIITYGGIIVSVTAPDKDGQFTDIVLGFDNIKDYEEKSPYFGCITGRYANRIAKGRFTLDGTVYDELAINNGPNHLHGGLKGFDKVVWQAHPGEGTHATGLKLHYLCKDMEEGYPGNMDVTVTYLLTDDNALKIEYKATTDKPTVCNLTNHTYFNLAGHGTESQYEHQMMINANAFTPIGDEGAIPTGEIRPVKGTPMDFISPTPIGLHIDDDDEQLKFGFGYDHNWVLNKEQEGELSLAARTAEPNSGRVLETWTTEPGVQFYSGNHLDGVTGKEGKTYPKRCAFCLETQHYPDSPNHPEFPSTVLRPGEKYQSTTVFKFLTK